MATEQTALLSGDDEADGGARPPPARRVIARQWTRPFVEPGIESKGVRPSRKSISGVPGALLNDWRWKRSRPSSSHAFRRGGGGDRSKTRRGQSRSFMQMIDGSISFLTPLEMGRQELYRGIPFIAVPGLQRRERNLSIAFSSYAAFLDNDETNDLLKSTSGAGMTEKKKEERVRRNSMLLLDCLESVGGATLTMPLVLAVLAASFMTFNTGYNMSVMNAAEAYAYPGHSTMMWSMAVSAFCIGGLVGVILAGKWADEKGRRSGLLLAAWLFIVGGLLQTVASTLSLAVVARAVIGVASGATSALVPIYLGEVAPPNLRGVIGTVTQFSLVMGILVADIIGFPLGNNEDEWRYTFLVTSALGVVPLVLRPFLLESPRWLLDRDPESNQARFTIKTLRGFRYDEEVETEVTYYAIASKTQSVGDDSAQHSKADRIVMKELFVDKKVRLLLVSTLVLHVANALSGINAVFFYSNLFLGGEIEKPLVGTTLMGTINVLATYVALLLMDRCGCRALIIWSTTGMLLSCVMVVLSMLGYFDQMVMLAAVALYVSFFCIGLGPIPVLIVAEMFDSKYMSAAMSLSLQLNWASNFVVALLFPYIIELLGPYSFGTFAVVLLVTLFYASVWLPEIAGNTPEELQAALIKKNENVTYHNMDIRGMAGALPRPKGKKDDALRSSMRHC